MTTDISHAYTSLKSATQVLSPVQLESTDSHRRTSLTSAIQVLLQLMIIIHVGLQTPSAHLGLMPCCIRILNLLVVKAIAARPHLLAIKSLVRQSARPPGLPPGQSTRPPSKPSRVYWFQRLLPRPQDFPTT
jgi:hypothetical protein